MKTVVQQRWQGARRSGAAFLTKLPARSALVERARLVQAGLANLFFPPSCMSCGMEMERGTAASDGAFCEFCLEEMEFFADPVCERCGAPVPFAREADESNPGDNKNLSQNRPQKGGQAHFAPKTAQNEPVPDGPGIGSKGSPRRTKDAGCYRCRGRKMWFDRAIALGHYEGQLRDLVLRMKEAAGDAVSLAIGRLMMERCGARLAACDVDVVVPIPLHWRRRIAHRTNSAAVLAEVLSAKLHVPRADSLLRRTRSTLRQFELNPPKRWENVRRAFAVRAGYHLRAAHVLLVDDILTTGATCSEAARALRTAGAARVTVAVVARAFGE